MRAVHHETLAPFEEQAIGRSLNFSFGPTGGTQVREAFTPADYQRLATLKAQYDPANVFHANHPIPPLTDAG